MSAKKIKTAGRAQAQAIDSSAGYDGTTWGRILRTVGPALSLHLNEVLERGERLENLAVLGGDSAVLRHLVRGWPTASGLGAVVCTLTELRTVAGRFLHLLPDDMRAQLAEPAPPGEVHALIVEADRVDIVTQPVRRVDLKPIQAPVIDPDAIAVEDLVALARLEAARHGVNLGPQELAEMTEFCRANKAAILTASARWAHGAAPGPAGVA